MKNKLIYWAHKLKHWAKEIFRFLLNPRLLLCLGIAWIITNGWSYICLTIGTACDIPWLAAISGAYMAFLWFPFTPEKIVTVIIAMFLLRWLFPNDEKTLKKLRELRAKYHAEWTAWKENRKQKKAGKKEEKAGSKEEKTGAEEKAESKAEKN